MPLVEVASRRNQAPYQGRITRPKRVGKLALGWTKEGGVPREPAVGLEILECAVKRATAIWIEGKRQAEDGILLGWSDLPSRKMAQRDPSGPHPFLLKRVHGMRML